MRMRMRKNGPDERLKKGGWRKQQKLRGVGAQCWLSSSVCKLIAYHQCHIERDTKNTFFARTAVAGMERECVSTCVFDRDVRQDKTATKQAHSPACHSRYHEGATNNSSPLLGD
jgi:hypothetical protein